MLPTNTVMKIQFTLIDFYHINYHHNFLNLILLEAENHEEHAGVFQNLKINLEI